MAVTLHISVLRRDIWLENHGDDASVALQVLDLAVSFSILVSSIIIKLVYWVRQHRKFILLFVNVCLCLFPQKLPERGVWIKKIYILFRNTS